MSSLNKSPQKVQYRGIAFEMLEKVYMGQIKKMPEPQSARRNKSPKKRKIYQNIFDQSNHSPSPTLPPINMPSMCIKKESSLEESLRIVREKGSNKKLLPTLNPENDDLIRRKVQTQKREGQKLKNFDEEKVKKREEIFPHTEVLKERTDKQAVKKKDQEKVVKLQNQAKPLQENKKRIPSQKRFKEIVQQNKKIQKKPSVEIPKEKQKQKLQPINLQQKNANNQEQTKKVVEKKEIQKVEKPKSRQRQKEKKFNLPIQQTKVVELPKEEPKKLEKKNTQVQENQFKESDWEPSNINETQIKIKMKAQYPQIQTKDVLEVPAMLSLQTKGGSRTSVDLICVLDVSGSMREDGKIDLLKNTINLLINGNKGEEYLTANDRLGIVTFSNKCKILCGLEMTTPQSKRQMTEMINEIRVGGGTDIDGGMKLALDILKERQGARDTTSILLLSDGVNEGAYEKFQKTLKSKQYSQIGNFSIHSFGFGSEHDEELMSSISKLRKGQFYFINQLSEITKAFCNVFGGLISMALTDVVIQLRLISKQEIQITKVYGDYLWERKDAKTYKIKLPQLATGVEKNFLLNLFIPGIQEKKVEEICEVIYQGKGINGKIIKDHCFLKIKFSEKASKRQNIDVTENHFRVRTSETIEEAMKTADKGKFEEARGMLARFQKQIQSNKKVRKEKVGILVEDLNKIIMKCNQDLWKKEGRKEAKNISVAHMMQNNFQYASSVQRSMVEKIKG